MHFGKLCKLPGDFPMLINKELVSSALYTSDDRVRVALEEAEKEAAKARKSEEMKKAPSESFVPCFVANSKSGRLDEKMERNDDILSLRFGSLDARVIDVKIARIQDAKSLNEHATSVSTFSVSQKESNESVKANEAEKPHIPGKTLISFFTLLARSGPCWAMIPAALPCWATNLYKSTLTNNSPLPKTHREYTHTH